MICLDTTFIIDFLKKDEGALKKAALMRNEVLLTTQINVFELFFGELLAQGANEGRLARLNNFLEDIDIITLSRESAIKSAEIAATLIKTGKTIQHNDCLIAGIAISNGVTTVITRNVKDFSKIKGLKVETY